MFPTICKRHVICVNNYVAMLQQCLAEALNKACRQNVLEMHRQKRYYDCHSGTVVPKPGDIVLLKMDSYTERQKTKDKWSNKCYTLLCQLGLDILTYEIEAAGGLTHIVHQSRLFLLFPNEGDDNCVPLVAFLHLETEKSSVHSLDYVPSVAGLSPGQCMRSIFVMDTCGLGYACPQARSDPVIGRYSDLTVGHIS